MNTIINKGKSERKVLRIIILILLLSSMYSFAQKGYEKGFVVLNTKDTLYGFIKDRKEHPFERLYRKIKFKGEKGRAKYKPSQILSYKKGRNTFESIWISDPGGFLNQDYHVIPGVGKLHFLRVVHKGFLSYYHWEYEDADSGYFDSIGYFKKEDDSSLIRVSQGIFGLRRKKLASFLNDCPDLGLIIRNKTIKNPREVIIFYNDWKRRHP